MNQVDPSGTIIGHQWEVTNQWVWTVGTGMPKDAGGYQKKLSYRTEITLPKGIELIPKESSTRVTVSQDKVVVEGNSLPPSFVADIKTKDGSIKENQKFVIFLGQNITSLLEHPDCVQLGIEFSKDVLKKLPLEYQILGAYCEVTFDHVNLYVIHSPNIQVKLLDLGQPTGSGPDWASFSLVKPDSAVDQSTDLGSIVMRDSLTKQTEKHMIRYNPYKVGKKYRLYLGVSTTFLAYKETPGSIAINEFAISVKGGGEYKLIDPWLSVDASAYMNALPLKLSSTGANGAARFYGLNGRLAYRLPFKTQWLEFKTMLGWYLWGMLVPGNEYGVKMLSGPQVFLQTNFMKYGFTWASLYFKFAPISDSSSFGISSNYEAAVGGSYRLSRNGAKFPFGLSADLSMLSVKEVQGAQNQISLTSASLGLTMGF